MRWHDRITGLQLFGGIGAEIDFRGGEIAVPEPERDLPDILGGVEDDHRTGMAQDVWGEVLGRQRGALLPRAVRMALQHVREPPAAQGLAARVDKQCYRSPKNV